MAVKMDTRVVVQYCVICTVCSCVCLGFLAYLRVWYLYVFDYVDAQLLNDVQCKLMLYCRLIVNLVIVITVNRSIASSWECVRPDGTSDWLLSSPVYSVWCQHLTSASLSFVVLLTSGERLCSVWSQVVAFLLSLLLVVLPTTNYFVIFTNVFCICWVSFLVVLSCEYVTVTYL